MTLKEFEEEKKDKNPEEYEAWFDERTWYAENRRR